MRIGKGNNLLAIGGISQDFLITGYRCIKDHLASRFTFGTYGYPGESSSVLQRQNGGVTQQKSLILGTISILGGQSTTIEDTQKRKKSNFRFGNADYMATRSSLLKERLPRQMKLHKEIRIYKFIFSKNRFTVSSQPEARGLWLSPPLFKSSS